MKGRVALILVTAAFAAITSVGPASARANQTITISCDVSGQTYVVDANALEGQILSNEHYNERNPLGETCVVTDG
jgi:hypothetical protein